MHVHVYVYAHTSVFLLVLCDGGVQVSELSGRHLQLLFLVTGGDVIQLSVELCPGLEEVVGQSMLQVVLLGLQAGALSQATPKLMLDGVNVLSQLLYLREKGCALNRRGMH